MGSPFDEGRDGNVAPGNAFGTQPDLPDENVTGLVHGFGQTTGHLSEMDYRDDQNKP